MARKRPRVVRKRRTREHIIADLCAHHVEGPILRVGFTAERIVHDYGVDLTMYTYNRHGEIEPDAVLFQLKATDHLKRSADGTAVLVRVERADLDGWLEQTFPVILIIYDAQTAIAYWLYIQRRFKGEKGPSKGTKKTVTIHVPVANVLNEDAVRHFATAKAAIQTQTRGVGHHG
jgi:hypothetical protein